MSINNHRLPVPALPDVMLQPLVQMALLEDLGRAGDLTTDTIVPADAQAQLRLVARQEGVLAGLDMARLAFQALDPQARFEVLLCDGADLQPGAEIARISGSARAMLSAERVALNYLCHLSGVATATASIARAIADQGRTIRIPVHLVENINRVKKTAGELLRKNGREPTVEEIAVQLDLEPDRVRELLQLAQDPISLETPVGEEEDAHLEDFIQDEEAGVPVDEAGRQLLRRELMNVLKSLTPREERVIALRFGLEDGRSRTLEELGREFNVTRERVRQIEAKALRKLRHPSRAKRLRDYLDE